MICHYQIISSLGLCEKKLDDTISKEHTTFKILTTAKNTSQSMTYLIFELIKRRVRVEGEENSNQHLLFHLDHFIEQRLQHIHTRGGAEMTKPQETTPVFKFFFF